MLFELRFIQNGAREQADFSSRADDQADIFQNRAREQADVFQNRAREQAVLEEGFGGLNPQEGSGLAL